MALFRYLVTAAVCIMAVPATAHYAGKSVPIMFCSSDMPQARLAAQVIASYFEDQMGRRIVLVETAGVPELFEQLVMRKAPMAVVPIIPADGIPEDVVFIRPGLDTGAGIFDLVMGAEATKDLQFSLVKRYMEMLSSGLTHEEWAKGIVMVNEGQGLRRVALDMLRESDLL